MQLFEYIDLLNQPYDIFITESTHCSPHWHYYCEILYMLEGSLEIHGDGKQTILAPGDLCFIYPMQIHEIAPAGAGASRYAVLKFDIHSLHLPQVYSGNLHSFFTKPSCHGDLCIHLTRKDLETAAVQSLVLQTVKEYENKDAFYMLQIHANLSTLLISLIRNAPRTADHTGTRTAGEPSFYQILEYIDAHSSSPLQVQELADMCHMSYSYFAKRFRETYGRSCKEYISYVRVSKAQEYLLHTDYDLNYIAMECGFFDCSHFIRTYKKWKGVTPKQARKLAGAMGE
ncbi:MAG: AraC family transcriptional regulator [Lachnospiraceae bacterium]|nr:AraC family transcriptional regulator [Lachnospiraceae bacterium]